MTPGKDINLIEVYKSVVQEYHFFVKLFEDRIKFYSSLLTAIVSALAAVAFLEQAQNDAKFVVFVLGSATLIFVASTADGAAQKAANQVNRILTERAKLEQALGLTIPYEYESVDAKGKNDLYWSAEPIISSKHLIDRKAHPTSQEFVDFNMGIQDSYLGRTISFYSFAKFLGLVGLIIAVWLYR